MKKYLAAILLSAICAPTPAQQPLPRAEPPLDLNCPKPAPTLANDACARARPIAIGETIRDNDNLLATKGLPQETPHTLETTCIQSVENDMWYAFQTLPGQEWYEITIATTQCNTPAGLQALVIRADDCTASAFRYRACSNKINTDTIKLFLHEPQPGLRHLIWIDGYDGTQCTFDISLQARPILATTDYRFLRYDYNLEPPHGNHLPDLSIGFENNVAYLQWQANSLDPVALYLVEQLPDLPSEQAYGRVVGILDPNAIVGTGTSTYRFEDLISNYQSGQPLRYRIVQVMTDGTREASEELQVMPRLIDGFYAAEVKPGTAPGTYTVHYLNHRKGQDLRLQVLDASMKVVKESILPKEPVRDGDITLQMAGFPPGQYTFIMSVGRDQFRRPFRHE